MAHLSSELQHPASQLLALQFFLSVSQAPAEEHPRSLRQSVETAHRFEHAPDPRLTIQTSPEQSALVTQALVHIPLEKPKKHDSPMGHSLLDPHGL